jgi:hypothetical protein
MDDLVKRFEDYEPKPEGLRCIHDWTTRGQGPGFTWRECWLCGDMTEYE